MAEPLDSAATSRDMAQLFPAAVWQGKNHWRLWIQTVHITGRARSEEYSCYNTALKWISIYSGPMCLARNPQPLLLAINNICWNRAGIMYDLKQCKTVARPGFNPVRIRNNRKQQTLLWKSTETHTTRFHELAATMAYVTRKLACLWRGLFNTHYWRCRLQSLSVSLFLQQRRVRHLAIFWLHGFSLRPPLWSSGQTSWLQVQRSRVRLPALLHFLSSSGSGTGSIDPLWGEMRSYLKEK
jgi:hypothetical protein